jgi:hypothetical protein
LKQIDIVELTEKVFREHLKFTEKVFREHLKFFNYRMYNIRILVGHEWKYKVRFRIRTAYKNYNPIHDHIIKVNKRQQLKKLIITSVSKKKNV